MPGKIKLTMACDDFDIVRPLIDGIVQPEGIELVFVTELTNPERHGLMVRDLAFDICELNVTNYLVARDQGVPVTAMPVFLFRMFRHGNIFINPASGIRAPHDLIGKRIGAANLQVAANVWITGIMQEFHGLAQRDMTWVLEREEDVPFAPPAGLRIERVAPARKLTAMLLDGEIDALLMPQPPQQLLDGDPRIVRLFSPHLEAELAYFRHTGIFPIMHVTAIRQVVVERYPWVPIAMRRAFEEAKRLGYKRAANTRVVPLAWFGTRWEEERHLLGSDPWSYGLDAANRRNLETITRYSHEQGLIRRPWKVDELFVGL